MIDVISLGTFEIMHRGHLHLFKKCRDIASNGRVIIGLNTDEFVEKYKGHRPILDYKEREKAILATLMVDSVVPNSQPNGNIKKVLLDNNPNLIVIGSDWGRKDYLKQLGLDWDWLDKVQIGVCYLNYTYGISTTEIKRRINEHI